MASAHAASLGVSPSPHAQDPCRPSPPAAKPSAVARAEQGLGSALSRHRGSGRKGELTRLRGLCPAAFGPQDTPGAGGGAAGTSRCVFTHWRQARGPEAKPRCDAPSALLGPLMAMWFRGEAVGWTPTLRKEAPRIRGAPLL